LSQATICGYPAPQQNSPLVFQGSATATNCHGGAAKSAYFSALGVQPTSGAGNPAGPGFPTTDTTDPLNVRFHCDISGSNGAGGSWSPTVIISYKPQLGGGKVTWAGFHIPAPHDFPSCRNHQDMALDAPDVGAGPVPQGSPMPPARKRPPSPNARVKPHDCMCGLGEQPPLLLRVVPEVAHQLL